MKEWSNAAQASINETVRDAVMVAFMKQVALRELAEVACTFTHWRDAVHKLAQRREGGLARGVGRIKLVDIALMRCVFQALALELVIAARTTLFENSRQLFFRSFRR